MKVPVNAIIANTIVTVLLSLVFLGSPVAFQALVSFYALSLYMSYFIAIAMFLCYRITNRDILYCPWRLGKLGIPINILALAFCLLPVVYRPFPQGTPITWASMNYSGPILGFILLAIAVSWILGAKNHFKGPIVGVTVGGGQGMGAFTVFSREQWMSEDRIS